MIDEASLASVIGDFSFTVTEELFALENSELVDQNDLFPDCNIDQTKFIIDDDTCEQGIVLFCRDQFFPQSDLSFAKLADFSKICDCTEFLCATLASGDDLNRSYQNFLSVFYGIFASLSVVGILIFLTAHFDLFFYGGFSYWMLNNKASVTWSFSALFLLSALIYYTTEITLAKEIEFMERISANFDIANIPVPTDELSYSFYDFYISDILERPQNLPAEAEGDFFLNEEARSVIPDGVSFQSNFSYLLYFRSPKSHQYKLSCFGHKRCARNNSFSGYFDSLAQFDSIAQP